MIHSKLKKGKTSELLVEFSLKIELSPSVIRKFYQTCKQQNVKVSNTTSLLPSMIRLYSIKQQYLQQLVEGSIVRSQQQDIEDILKSRITDVQLQFTIIYINEQTYSIPSYQTFVSEKNQHPRVLLLRQTLEPYYHLSFQTQSTSSENESVIYLCQLAATIINSKHEKDINQHDKKKEKLIRKGNEGEMSQLEVIWKNILFQIPGIGKDKCKIIAEKFPTYQHVLRDNQKDKKLKNLEVLRGTKSSKLGVAVAERIYKVFTSLDGSQKLF